MICVQTRAPGISVSQVARRYDVNANQVFNWLKDSAFAQRPEDEEIPAFLPVEVMASSEMNGEPATINDQIEIELGDSLRMTVTGAYDPDALARLIRGISG